MLIKRIAKKNKPTEASTKRCVARVNLKDVNNEMLDGVGPLKPPNFGNSSHTPTVQRERAATSPGIKAMHLSHGPEQMARMAQTGLETLQRSVGGEKNALLGIHPAVMGVIGHRQVLPCLYLPVSSR